MNYRVFIILLLVLGFAGEARSQSDIMKFLKQVHDSSYAVKVELAGNYVLIYAFNKQAGSGIFKVFTSTTETLVYSHDDITCGFIGDTVIDIDGTGTMALVVELSRSCLSHQVNQLLVFQIGDEFKLISKFNNTTIVYRPEAFPVFRVRLGHFFSNYNYSTLEYFYLKDGKQILFAEKDDPVLKEAVDVCRNKELHLLEMKADSAICQKGSGDFGKYRSVWQSYFEQAYYAGMKEDAKNFFDLNYDCIDKMEFQSSLEKR